MKHYINKLKVNVMKLFLCLTKYHAIICTPCFSKHFDMNLGTRYRRVVIFEH